MPMQLAQRDAALVGESFSMVNVMQVNTCSASVCRGSYAGRLGLGLGLDAGRAEAEVYA